MSVSGGSLRDERIVSSQYLLDSLFKDDPSYREDVTIWNSEDIIGCRIYEHKHVASGTPQRQIQTLNANPIYVGNIFKIGDDGYWMCIDSSNIYHTNWQGILEYCNYILRFILDGIVYEYPVVIKNASQANSGEQMGSQIILGDSQRLIYIPYDSNTIRINNGVRFLIDKNTATPTAYKVTQVDTTSYYYENGGMLQISVVEDQFSNEYDNLELMVADYYKPVSKTHIQILNVSSPVSLQNGTSLQLDVYVEKDGEPYTGIIQYSSTSDAIANVSNEGIISANSIGECDIIISVDSSSETIHVVVQESQTEDIYNVSLIPSGDDPIIYGSTEKFSIEIYKNGKLVNDVRFNSEIKSDGDFVYISNSGDNYINITVQDDKALVGKSFTLRIWNDELKVDKSLVLKVGGYW